MITRCPLLLAIALTLASASQAEELTAYVYNERNETGSQVVLSLKPVKGYPSAPARFANRLRQKVRRLKGNAQRFVVQNEAGIKSLENLSWMRVRVEGDFDRSAGTAVIRTLLSPQEVTLTGVVTADAAYTQNGAPHRSQGLKVGDTVIALPGLHHFGNVSRVVDRQITVRGRYFELDNVLSPDAIAATVTEETTLSRLATEYGTGVEGSPMVTTDHVLAAGTEVWVSAAHPIHYGDFVDVVDAEGRSGLAIPEVLNPRADSNARPTRLTPTAPAKAEPPAKSAGPGLREALEQSQAR